MSERLGIYSEPELRAARDLAREIVRVVRSFRLYEGNHPTLGEMHLTLRQKWEVATTAGPLALRLTERKILLGDEQVYQTVSNKDVVPTMLYEHGIVGLVFRRGIDPGEIRRLVEVLAEEPDPSVDYAAMLWDADLQHLQVLLDADSEDDEEPIESPEDFAEQLASMSEPDDPPVGEDYEDEAIDVEAQVALEGPADPEAEDPDRFVLTEGEQLYAARMLEGEHYRATLRHAARVVHAMIVNADSAAACDGLEAAIRAIVDAVTASSDLEGAVDIIKRATELAARDSDHALRFGEMTVDLFREPKYLWTLLRGLDQLQYVDARTLNELLARLGPSVAPLVGEWLIETKYPDIVAKSMRMYGDGAAASLIPLYERSDAAGRTRVGVALLEIGSPDALLALAEQFADLPEASRLQILTLIGREPGADLRRVVYLALTDPDESVRRAAVGALRRPDAPAIAELLPGFLEGALPALSEVETTEFFEALSRIGDRELAEALAEIATPKGLLTGFRKLTPLQEQCVRALRRMRASDARAVVEELRRTGPRAVREILEDNFTL